MSLLDGINKVFNHAGFRRLWLRIRIPAGLLILCLLVLAVQLEWFWFALVVSLIGEGIQLWCFATLHKGREVACRGPYACVRNPMYLGRYFIVLGFILLLGIPGLWLLPFYTVFYWFYMRNRVAREEAYLSQTLGEDYAAYCREVNRFLPSFRHCSVQSLLYWNWGWFTRNHGWLNAFSLIAVYAVLFIVAGVIDS